MRRILKLFIFLTIFLLIAASIFYSIDKQILVERLISRLPIDKHIPYGRGTILIKEVKGNRLVGVEIYDRHDPLKEVVIRAESADFIIDDRGRKMDIILRNGTIEEKMLKNEDKVYLMSFKEYTMTIDPTEINKKLKKLRKKIEEHD
ncbi:MAG: hypothetical protein KAJ66_01220 [Candidatus Omnitrophica bacterium]|nr:hypothetical protein [Candidatus Omnitrophota bacterium]